MVINRWIAAGVAAGFGFCGLTGLFFSGDHSRLDWVPQFFTGHALLSTNQHCRSSYVE